MRVALPCGGIFESEEDGLCVMALKQLKGRLRALKANASVNECYQLILVVALIIAMSL
jgi:hypothetical protein